MHFHLGNPVVVHHHLDSAVAAGTLLVEDHLGHLAGIESSEASLACHLAEEMEVHQVVGKEVHLGASEASLLGKVEGGRRGL
jgi:hypothetical protein